MRRSDPYIVLAGVAVALAVVGLTGFVVARLSATTPVVIAAVLGAVATVLAAVPPIIKALRGGR
jgi:predicted tellurium resistance membrane protein TerC